MVYTVQYCTEYAVLYNTVLESTAVFGRAGQDDTTQMRPPSWRVSSGVIVPYSAYGPVFRTVSSCMVAGYLAHGVIYTVRALLRTPVRIYSTLYDTVYDTTVCCVLSTVHSFQKCAI